LNIHEEMFARNFINPKKRDRYLSLLDTSKGRSKIAHVLDHCEDIDRRYANQVPVNQQNPNAIEKMLRQKGAPEVCHVMSTNPEIDEKEMPLGEALKKTIGMGMGTLISCIPGRLAYFEYEDAGERYVLER
jgi:hypothetical protein